MKKQLLTICLLSIYSYGQNIFPIKLDQCKVDRFCLDCGDQKVTIKDETLHEAIDKINAIPELKGISGKLTLQVLVDKKGKPCVLSHTDSSNHPLTAKVIAIINATKKWSPAITDGQIEEKTSVNFSVNITNGVATAGIERVDMNAFKANFDHPKDPEIFNTHYTYKNENLPSYHFTVWNNKNSNIPSNQNDYIAIDANGAIWVTADEYMTKWENQTFFTLPQLQYPNGNFAHFNTLAIDHQQTIWTYAMNSIYSTTGKEWTKHDPSTTGIESVYDIYTNHRTKEVFFCSDQGLTILKDNQWTSYTQKQWKDLPSNRVYFAQRDSKNRLWIGTFEGTMMIDEHGKTINFEKTQTILNGKCITAFTEDEQGNVYFTLYEFGDKNKGKVNRNEGIAIYSTDGKFTQFTTDNSGLPFNHTNAIVYDKNEKVVWISTDRAGLVRYDLNGNWENYHNKNSAIPTSYLSNLALDAEGNLYLATRQGVVKMQKK
ncbi:ligand-binding sensor domain-containing protein [Faecalibacter sp. LW9]|uniref:ligand-binding sensor domain-containing protein n=1 Tax=Faecalibacter sp. LW9 TaxID=3103144 RepID=UPI002AFE3F7C|nr:two-component regulator propeller domain-containing protein [Faecalibacter sp. LW9]